MRQPTLKAVSQPVNYGDDLVFLVATKISSENRASVHEQVSPVNALKRSCGTSCAALSKNYTKLQIYGNAV